MTFATHDLRNLAKYVIATLCFALAAGLMAVNLARMPFAEVNGSLGSMVVGSLLFPFWMCCGFVSLEGAVKTAFWLAVSPIILTIAVVGLASLGG